MRQLDEAAVEAACLGGGVYASGGGGWFDHGMQNGLLAVRLGRPRLATIDEIPQEGVIVTIAAIGAPAAADWEMQPRDYLRAFELIRETIHEPIVGLMNGQNGYSSTVNCWLPAALYDIPAIDVAGDTRAHPTIKLGSMGLASDPLFRTVQTQAGGNRAQGSYLELVIKGNIFKTSNILRRASVESGGFIASARLPLPVAYVRKHGALGAVSLALSLGEAIRAARDRGADAMISAILRSAGGRILGNGVVRKPELRTEGGFDHARYTIVGDGDPFTVYTLNEIMAVDHGSERVATFPDVIALLSLDTGLPLPVSHLHDGTSVAVFQVPKAQIPLSSSVKDPQAYPELEQIIGIELSRYALA
ncbi:MAG: DUF917 family protein [Deltaproteobacteria bacterium]|nr:DUF917 family protein [Deltaproteobacteria bacterium]